MTDDEFLKEYFTTLESKMSSEYGDDYRHSAMVGHLQSNLMEMFIQLRKIDPILIKHIKQNNFKISE